MFVGRVADRLLEERQETESHRKQVALILIEEAETCETASIGRNLLDAAHAVYWPFSNDEQREWYRKTSATASRRTRILGDEESNLNKF